MPVEEVITFSVSETVVVVIVSVVPSGFCTVSVVLVTGVVAEADAAADELVVELLPEELPALEDPLSDAPLSVPLPEEEPASPLPLSEPASGFGDNVSFAPEATTLLPVKATPSAAVALMLAVPAVIVRSPHTPAFTAIISIFAFSPVTLNSPATPTFAPVTFKVPPSKSKAEYTPIVPIGAENPLDQSHVGAAFAKLIATFPLIFTNPPGVSNPVIPIFFSLYSGILIATDALSAISIV